MSKKYYVYCAYGVNGEILYIGKGSGNRYQHCNNGASANKDLNRYYFSNGEDGSITVKILHHFDDDKSALHYEKDLIIKHKPLYNTDFCKKTTRKVKNRQNREDVIGCLERGYKVDFSRLLKKYIEAIEDDDVGLVEMIENKSEEHRRIVDVLGIERIKTIGFNKTRLMNAYRLALKFSENNLLIKSKLSGIKVGEKYTSSYLMNLLQKAYDSASISRKAVSYDILNYFSAKKTQVVGDDGKRKQGYLILDDLYKEDYL